MTSVGLSIGCAIYPEDGTEGQALINAADKAMYSRKHGKHGKVQQESQGCQT